MKLFVVLYAADTVHKAAMDDFKKDPCRSSR